MLPDIFYFILLLFVIDGRMAENCDDLLSKRLPPVAKECYSSFNNCSTKANCYFTPNVTFDIVDDDFGIVNAKFSLPSLQCCFTKYKIELLAIEGTENSLTCPENIDLYKIHSSREYLIHKCKTGSCEDDACGQYGNVNFYYAFSSCYILRIIPYIKGSSYASLFSAPMYFQTHYIKVKVADLIPTISPQYRDKERLFEVKIATNSTFESIIVTFVGDLRELVDETCERDGIDHSCCLVKQDGNSSLCEENDVKLDKRGNCVFQNLNCIFYNVSPGNYCIRIRIEDDRCTAGTLWTSKNACRWSHNLVVSHQEPDVPGVATPSIVVGLVILGVILLLLLGLFFLLFKRRAHPVPIHGPGSVDEDRRPIMNKMKVLLLYPRDCQDFMKVMESLRIILQKFNNVEVFDCFSNDEVLNGPLAWLQSIMSQPDLYTIIVTSQCALLQQKALKSGEVTNNYCIYKEPTFLDALFIYGLRLIMEDVSPDNYEKNFVIGFSGFSESKNILTLPTSFRRHILPEHLERLLSDMNIENLTENVHLQNSPEFTNLKTNLKNLIEYKSENPHYLENLLNLKEVEV